MLFDESLELLSNDSKRMQEVGGASLERFRAEVDFAKDFAELFPAKTEAWRDLILDAIEHVNRALSLKGALNIDRVVSEAEKILAPIGENAKEYTIHCCGHAHIDMNWMWPWQETISVTMDTFSTVDKLMTEFPEFHFSQSQASVYIAMEEYAPEIFKAIKRRVKKGQWDITASMWVEGDKNIVSGESLCRHLLYTRQYFKQKLGLDPEAVKLDWSCDTFGHAHTLPSILSRGGVSRYYHCRTGPGPWLYKWRSPDGSEILAFNDKGPGGYNGTLNPGMANAMVKYTKECGAKDYLYMYGVGDHGGGPTRADLRRARDYAKWSIFPVVKLSTTDAYFTAVENANLKLPVIDKDLNFTFEGCYTAQSNIKLATRVSEIILPEAETMAAIAGALGIMDYPYAQFVKAWRHTLFNHFHDILPGSGVQATYQYSQGLFQEIQATAGAIRSRALRGMMSKINTSLAAQHKVGSLGSGLGDGLGAGAGDPSIAGGMSAYNPGAMCAEPFVIYNQKPWTRSEMVYGRVWDKPVDDNRVVVRDTEGNEIKGQVTCKGQYWGHSFVTVAFQAKDVPALGYKVYAIDQAATTVPGEGASFVKCLTDGTETMIREVSEPGVMENEYLRVQVDQKSGAIKHLIDKATGHDYVPKGQLLGVIEACIEAPRGMTAWVIGPIKELTELTQNGDMQVAVHDNGRPASRLAGPNRVAVRTDHKCWDSRISVEIGLNAGSRMVDFTVKLHWVERGTRERGVPMLRVAFPVNVTDGVPTYEIPFGSQSRAQSPQEIPALKWADLSDGERGLTLVNNCKYGHSCNENTMRLTLIRGSYDPDPLPEIADHEIKFAVIPHTGSLDVVNAIRVGEEFNSPMAVLNATVQEGELPGEKSFVEVLTPNVFVSTVKRAEVSDALVIRMFETQGKKTTAKIKINDLVKAGAEAVETDVLERPVAKNTAKFDGEVLSVTVPAYGQATVMIG